MSEIFSPRIEGVSANSASFDFHAHRVARAVLETEETAKRVELQREIEVEVNATRAKDATTGTMLDVLA